MSFLVRHCVSVRPSIVIPRTALCVRASRNLIFAKRHFMSFLARHCASGNQGILSLRSTILIMSFLARRCVSVRQGISSLRSAYFKILIRSPLDQTLRFGGVTVIYKKKPALRKQAFFINKHKQGSDVLKHNTYG